MTRNWYAVYTKPRQEKKVAALLSRRKIHNYYPVNTVTRRGSNKRPLLEPLFNSFVFVFVNETELLSLKKFPGISHFVYWLSRPATIKEEEIEVLQQFTAVYENIRIEKTAVNRSGTIRVVDDPVISFKENSATIKFQLLKVVLPSLGYTLIAEREKVQEEAMQMVKPESIFKQPNPLFLSN